VEGHRSLIRLDYVFRCDFGYSGKGGDDRAVFGEGEVDRFLQYFGGTSPVTL